MKMDSLHQNLQKVQEDRAQAENANLMNFESKLESCISAELTTLRNSIAHADAALGLRIRQAILLVLITAFLSCLTLAVAMTLFWFNIAKLDRVKRELAESQDQLARLRENQWEPIGRPFSTRGRTFVELKPKD